MDLNTTNAWQWFSVKLIFEYRINGEPEPDTIDQNYTNTHKTYEESIILIKAQSFDHAYKIAEIKAIDMEMCYTNPYGETVECTFSQAIDCYKIGDEKLCTGVELYSRSLRTPKNVDTEDFLGTYYPDTLANKIDYNYILRNKEFNSRPNSIEKTEKK